MSLTITFSGPSPATNTVNEIASSGIYTGGSPDFTAATVVKSGVDYTIVVNNFGGVGGWPGSFVMSKADGDPANPLGSYEGGDGMAVVSD
ncbi:MAG: hypothetical protein AAF328_00325 [Planctomycetota bacterium]